MAGESVLLVGGGGREHAIAEAINESPNAPDTLYCTQSNVGIETMAGDMSVVNVDCSPTDVRGVLSYVEQNVPDPSKLTVIVGPEAPLIAGMADHLRENGLSVFGPSAEAARLEGSKIFATELMRQFDIPHPATTIVRNRFEAEQALKGIDPRTVVLKTDRAEASRADGVVLPKTYQEMMAAAQAMLTGTYPDGQPKNGFLVQERLTGPEVSVFVVSDGRGGFSIIPYFAQDHKRLNDGDQGPNTGGMGAYSPMPEGYLTLEQLEKIEVIAAKTIAGLESRGIAYNGFLYLSLMMAEQYEDDPFVIEYNCRFGDPEAQVVLPLLSRSGTDVYEMFYSTARGDEARLRTHRHLADSALAVTLAAAGYPGKPREGNVIHGLDNDYPDVRVYHGGTKRRDDGKIVTKGGRVLYVTGFGRDIDEAAAAAYGSIGANGIHFNGMHHRRDIGRRIRRR